MFVNVVVAGGAGMIGSHLCEQLLLEDRHVFCIDNLSTGRIGNVAAWLDHPRFTFLRNDIVDELPELPKVDQIFHLASPASPPGYVRLPVETLRANSEGTLRLLRLARRDRARFVFCSTSEIYGDPLEHPQRETYRGNVSSIGPRSMYDEAKRFGEAMTSAFVGAYGVDATIVRIFNTYGPRSDPEDGRVLVNFIVQALYGEPITVYGDGTQTRSLCYVSDLVDGLLQAMASSGLRGKVINLGNPDERTVLECAQLVRTLTGSRSKIVHTRHAVGDDPQRRRPDITLARTLLGWEPSVELERGLELTIRYFRDLGLPRETQVTSAPQVTVALQPREA
jgi:nucleoside-diphosphate-sugar epimerase